MDEQQRESPIPADDFMIGTSLILNSIIHVLEQSHLIDRDATINALNDCVNHAPEGKTIFLETFIATLAKSVPPTFTVLEGGKDKN